MHNPEHLHRMVTFATVVHEGSFTKAARTLGVSKAAVSKQVKRLEEALGTRLLHRTTRRLSLTEIGATFHEKCVQLVDIATEAEDVVRRGQAEPRGTLRISAPMGPGQHMVAPAVASFAKKYPELRIALQLDDAVVNLVDERVDVAIRAGKLSDSSLRARKVADLAMRICASPAYLRRRGTPRVPADLAKHDWLGYSMLGDPQPLRFARDGQSETVRLRGHLTTNDGVVLRDWLLAGLGVTMLPDFWVASHCTDKKLRPLLTRYSLHGGAIYAIHAHGSQPPPKVRLFIDHLVERRSPPRRLRSNTRDPHPKNRAAPRTL